MRGSLIKALFLMKISIIVPIYIFNLSYLKSVGHIYRNIVDLVTGVTQPTQNMILSVRQESVFWRLERKKKQIHILIHLLTKKIILTNMVIFGFMFVNIISNFLPAGSHSRIFQDWIFRLKTVVESQDETSFEDFTVTYLYNQGSGD